MTDCLGGNVKINLKLTEYKHHECIVKKYFVFSKFGEFIDRLIDYQLLKKSLLFGVGVDTINVIKYCYPMCSHS
jgi:hypothetical protein